MRARKWVQTFASIHTTTYEPAEEGELGSSTLGRSLKDGVLSVMHPADNLYSVYGFDVALEASNWSDQKYADMLSPLVVAASSGVYSAMIHYGPPTEQKAQEFFTLIRLGLQQLLPSAPEHVLPAEKSVYMSFLAVSGAKYVDMLR